MSSAPLPFPRRNGSQGQTAPRPWPVALGPDARFAPAAIPAATSGSASGPASGPAPAPAPEPGLPSAAADLAADFPRALLRQGLVRAEDLVPALLSAARSEGTVSARLVARGALDEDTMLQAATRHFGVAMVDPAEPTPPPAPPLRTQPGAALPHSALPRPAAPQSAPPRSARSHSARPDPALIDRLGLQTCLRHAILPWRRIGAATLVLTAHPEEFYRLRPMIEARLGPVLMALAPTHRIEQAILARRGARLAALAETRVAARESCRTWAGLKTLQARLLALLIAGALLVLAPVAVLLAALGLCVGLLVLSTGLRLAATLAALRPAPPDPAPLPPGHLPQISLIVALYREADIAPRLVRRLSQLAYPRELLDVLIAVEEEDHTTRDALAQASLPPWMRTVIVPAGSVKTKPRALNVALDHCRGEIVGVYDAEDAPDPDQLHQVAAQFRASDPDVACLQGMLDYYNPATNWLSRCFTIEYATWFRLILPGIARLGLAVPLGGTTLFFRRGVLEGLGGWDAHNVTEDADLGIRLARHGYRTQLLHSVTREEANCRAIPWVKQRSRWIKGYMMTWLVHMRDPVALWRQLGPRAFAGFQIMVLGSVLQALLAPLLWSFWLLALGLPHPLAAALPQGAMPALITLFLLSETATVATGLIALHRSGHRLSPLWVPTLHLYFPLAVLAAYKALWEVARRPFYWDKTHHGLFDPVEEQKPL